MNKMLNEKRKVSVKQLVALLLTLFVLVSPIFAEGADELGLNAFGQKVLDIFTANWLKALLIVALVVEAIMMVVSGQQGGGAQVFKKFSPWIIGTLVILSASSITGYFTEGIDDAFKLD